MFPDLRLLISATVATFFLAATAGLYASLRTQDQIAARADSRIAMEDSPATRIAATWPMLEPGRASALRELSKIAKNSPVASEPSSVPEREATQSTLPDPSHASLKDAPLPQDVTGSTGIATAPETGTVNQSDHPDIQGNIGGAPDIRGDIRVRVEKDRRPTVKKPRPVLTKKAAKAVQRRKTAARIADPFPDPLTAGYPLYLTVPVTN